MFVTLESVQIAAWPEDGDAQVLPAYVEVRIGTAREGRDVDLNRDAPDNDLASARYVSGVIEDLVLRAAVEKIEQDGIVFGVKRDNVYRRFCYVHPIIHLDPASPWDSPVQVEGDCMGISATISAHPLECYSGVAPDNAMGGSGVYFNECISGTLP